mgnify:CR=1 FL=1
MLFCSFISCVILVNLLFQFFNDRYLKAYNSTLLYIFLQIACVAIVTPINMFMSSLLNLIVNVIWVGVVSYFFYYEEKDRRFIQIFESEALFMVIGIAEALGVFLIDVIMEIMQITPQSVEIQKSIETAFSKIILLFLYYVIFSRLWKKSNLRTKTQYILYLIMFLYSVVNVLIIAVISNKENPLILMVIVGCTIFANMYLLYFIKFSDERNYYKMQLEMMEQQEKIQYDNYEIQSEKYKEAMTILHDVDKHMKMIEGLYQEDFKREALSYTNQIREMLQPLIPFTYTDNPVLNCLLSDKKRAADRSGISFKIEINQVDINFMKPIDITTLFGNLIDNALEATKKCNEEKNIGLYIKEYNEMISIRIENGVEAPVVIKNGKIYSSSERSNGIGLLNIQRCIEDYLGSIIYKYFNQLLVCDIVLNRVDE